MLLIPGEMKIAEIGGLTDRGFRGVGVRRPLMPFNGIRAT